MRAAVPRPPPQVFSFIWPHLKLLLLQLFFYLPLRPAARRNGGRAASRRLRRGRVAHARALRAGNYWLAFFGKWTLADVLVMTCLLGPPSAPRPASAAKTRPMTRPGRGPTGLLNINAHSSIGDVWSSVRAQQPQLCNALCDALAPPPASPGFDNAAAVLDAAGNGANCTRLCAGVAELLSATLLWPEEA